MNSVKQYPYQRFRKAALMMFISIIMMTSCQNEKGNVPASIVHNPISASGEGDLGQLPVIEFREILHDFGTVIEGETVIYNFKFKNTGKSDLILTSVSASCGCTATKYTKDPIAPDGEGVITVTFDTRNRKGFQNKTVTVMANTQPAKTLLRIKAKVISPSEL